MLIQTGKHHIMQNRQAIVAVGRTKFGEHYGKEPEKLIEEAWLAASNECNLERKDLQACYMLTASCQSTNNLAREGFSQNSQNSTYPGDHPQLQRCIMTACHAIQAGVYNTVLVGGIEKMSDRLDKIRDDLMLLDDPWSYYAGGTPESNHELMMRAYIKKHGLTGQDIEQLETALAQVAVKNHANATKNKYAQFQRKITIDQVRGARKAASKPLGLFDFAPISDGASAIVLTSEEVAKTLTDHPVYILGCGSATDYLNYSTREDLTRFLAAELAMKSASQTAKVSPSQLQLLELYDQSP